MRLPCRYGIANEFTNVKGFLCCGSLNSFTEDSLLLSCKVNRKSSTKQQVMLCPSLSVSKCSSPWSMSNAAKQFDRDLGRALCNYQSPDITSTYSATSTQRSRDFSILSFPGPNLFKILSRRSSKSQRRARPNVAFTQVRLEQQGRRDGAHRGRQHLQRHLRRFDSKSPDIVGTHRHLQHALREKRFGSSCVDHGWRRKGSCRTIRNFSSCQYCQVYPGDSFRAAWDP